MTHPIDPVVEEFARKNIRPGAVVTWLNHWSIQHANWPSLAQMTSIGVDGTALQLALNRAGFLLGRTSADLVLPVAFAQMDEGSRIALIGAAPGVATKAAARLPRHEVIAIDGYEGLSGVRADAAALREFDPAVIVLGLGAGLQEEVALELHAQLPQAAICTAGGWIDQLAKDEQYFPPWIHKYRLGWAWRIAHEPRRLLGRYTVDAVRFAVALPQLVRRLRALPHRAEPTGLTLKN